MGNYKFISPLPFFSYLCMHAIVLNSCLSLALTGSNETDKLALLKFKARITTDPFGVMSSWNETIHFCQWHGVTCGHRHMRVTKLMLRSLKLGGSISPHVGNLSFLKVFNLVNESFSHEIPPEIGLRRLQLLALQNNSLSGEIPANLSSENQLHGEIPSLKNLHKLWWFVIGSNHLGSDLSFLCDLTNATGLQSLEIDSNNFGDIFGRLTNFNFLALDGNDLSGTIPSSVFNVSSLETFAVGLNYNLQGTFPSNLGNSCPSLQTFAISYNQFSGIIPVSISNASNLFELAIHKNQLRGEVPSLKNLHNLGRFTIASNHLGSGGTGDDLSFLCDLTNATGLQYLEINSNNFGGTLPQCVANLSYSLVYFYVGYNSIFGNIPNAMENLHNLESIWLSGNQFSGLIPPEIGRLPKLYEVYMETNSLTGNLPSSFGNLSRLTHLHLEDNNLQGTIPSTLSQCPNLVNLTLGGNNFTGIISPELIRLSSSYVHLDLSRNHLTGFLPMEVGQLINLGHFDVSGNLLSQNLGTEN
ncbi:putative receptor-like protein kinase At3g47110 [Pyrus x bretschneideri]|uniref:putative receptor-like protein kinase At3g47110 n=1 Tax=Pyrus x bretschneideri TaxID=225117 RepID=UPI00202EA66A|nr:putative receptor-like protein kinase At3g47110 [Pyrus x bretschneideri]